MESNEKTKLAQLIINACTSTLLPEESEAIILRYGLRSGKPMSNPEVSRITGSGTRDIKSEIKRSLQKIREEHQKQQSLGNYEHPAVHLMDFLEERIEQDDEGYVEYQELINTELQDLAHYPETQKMLETLLGYPGRGKTVREIFDDLLSNIYWPKNPKILAEQDLDEIIPGVYQGNKNNYYAGYFYSLKMDREIRYISLIHLHFLLNLEYSDKVGNFYECPFKISYEKNNSISHLFPHAFYTTPENRGVAVEILAVEDMAREQSREKMAALKKFCSQKGYGILITDGKISIQQVMKREVNPEFEKSLLERLKKGPLGKEGIAILHKSFRPQKDDLVTIALRHKLTWENSPMRISMPKNTLKQADR